MVGPQKMKRSGSFLGKNYPCPSYNISDTKKKKKSQLSCRERFRREKLATERKERKSRGDPSPSEDDSDFDPRIADNIFKPYSFMKLLENGFDYSREGFLRAVGGVDASSGREKRIAGGNPFEKPDFAKLVHLIRSNSTEFEAQGRILRLKNYIGAHARAVDMDIIIEALRENTRVEVLYIQNFEDGMHDQQLYHLVDVLKERRIWALNIGENANVSAWGRREREKFWSTVDELLYCMCCVLLISVSGLSPTPYIPRVSASCPFRSLSLSLFHAHLFLNTHTHATYLLAPKDRA